MNDEIEVELDIDGVLNVHILKSTKYICIAKYRSMWVSVESHFSTYEYSYMLCMHEYVPYLRTY